ncbi:MAG: histidinol-phosphatase [Spirochaetaceae bacterium]|nr:MAG: histidinol-phosphatase [Spirochaetaceae bacterium]
MSHSIITNYHCHSRFDDGHGELEEYVQAALKKNLRTLGFAGHAPVPFACGWTIPSPLLPEYLQTARRLQNDYRDKIEILVGLEVDYIPEIISPVSVQIRALKLDFTVGSVHFIGRLADGTLWTPDGPVEELEQGLAESYGGDARKAVEEYFHRMTALVGTAPPDVIGHFDVVKKNNRGGKYFSEDAPWYRKAVDKTLDALAASPCILEINTGGIVRGTSGALYPSEWILAGCLKRQIPVMINSDAHRPAQLDGYYSEAAAILKDIGFRELTQIGREGRRRVPLV